MRSHYITQKVAGNVHWKQCWYRKRVSNQKTKNEPEVGRKFHHGAKTPRRSKADTLVMDRQNEGSEDLWRQR